MAPGNRHAVMAASRHALCQAKFGSAPDSRPSAILADVSVCNVAGFDEANKELGVLVNGMVLNGDWPWLKDGVFGISKERRLSRMILVTHNIASDCFI